MHNSTHCNSLSSIYLSCDDKDNLSSNRASTNMSCNAALEGTASLRENGVEAAKSRFWFVDTLVQNQCIRVIQCQWNTPVTSLLTKIACRTANTLFEHKNFNFKTDSTL